MTYDVYVKRNMSKKQPIGVAFSGFTHDRFVFIPAKSSFIYQGGYLHLRYVELAKLKELV